MVNSTNRFFLEKLGATQATSFVGDRGEMFYDPDTGVLRVSDGTSPGGIILGALGSTGYVGAFHDTTVQNNAAEINKFRYNSTTISDGVAVVANTQLKVYHTGNYNIQFSAQIDKTDAGNDHIDIWLRKNGNDLEHTNTRVWVEGNNAKNVAAWNWVASASANDYFEVVWYSPDTQIRIYAEEPQTGPTRPGIPSIIITVTQV